MAEIRRNLEKEYEERMREIRFISAGISDVIDRRNYCLDIEKKIKEHQEEERENRLALTLEYSMLVFSLAGSSVEDVEKVCDVVKLFVETGHVSANKDLLIPLNKKLRNAEVKQFVTNMMLCKCLHNTTFSTSIRNTKQNNFAIRFCIYKAMHDVGQEFLFHAACS